MGFVGCSPGRAKRDFAPLRIWEQAFSCVGMKVLGIETSCDETAAAVVEIKDGRVQVLSNVIHSQVRQHAIYGGVVPEVASREHIARIAGLIAEACSQAGGPKAIDGVAVTRGPGLVGALLVGLQAAKGFALARGVPFVAVNHLEGHLCAGLLADKPPSYPHLALIVSGGHTHLYDVRGFGAYRLLGHTRDDAAGEAFDKIAKTLGLGYPGGIAIERVGRTGNPRAVALPRAMAGRGNYHCSFSGLKTAASEVIRRRGGVLEGQDLADFCASVQEAIADVLSKKAIAAAGSVGAPGIALAGGVAANTRLRELFAQRCKKAGLWLFAPPKPLCTDNAAMIAAAGAMRLAGGQRSGWDTSVVSRWPLDTLGVPTPGVLAYAV